MLFKRGGYSVILDELNTNMEHWWNHTDTGKQMYYKHYRSVESYHAYVVSSKRTLENGRGGL